MHQIQLSERVKQLSFTDHPLPAFLHQRNSVILKRDFGLRARKTAINALLTINQPRFDPANRGGDHG